MAILNATPDSFFDGGRHATLEAALRRAELAVEQGAAILDIGGESSRPGAVPVGADEERERVVPVIRACRRRFALPISVDTTKASVAQAALAEGADIVNDISGFTFDSAMPGVVARHRAAVVLMHIQGTPRTMQQDPRYLDVVAEVAGFLARQKALAVEQGVVEEAIALDPGIGFGKTAEHCGQLLARLPRFAALGSPILVGVSRKSFIGKMPGLEGSDRLQPSVALALFAALQGATILRVHDVRETWEQLRAVRVLLAWDRATA